MPRMATCTGCGSLTFGEAFNQGNKSNAYIGAYTLYTPLSRRLLLITNIPFVLLQQAAGDGLPTISPAKWG